MKWVVFILILFAGMTAMEYCNVDIVSFESVRIGKCTLNTDIVFEPEENVFTSTVQHYL